MLLLVSEPVKGYSLFLAAWIQNNYNKLNKISDNINKHEMQGSTLFRIQNNYTLFRINQS